MQQSLAAGVAAPASVFMTAACVVHLAARISTGRALDWTGVVALAFIDVCRIAPTWATIVPTQPEGVVSLTNRGRRAGCCASCRGFCGAISYWLYTRRERRSSNDQQASGEERPQAKHRPSGRKDSGRARRHRTEISTVDLRTCTRQSKVE